MIRILKALLFFQFAGIISANATSLVVFHNPSDGVILATDSVVAAAKLGDPVKRGQAKPLFFRTECKINTCKPFIIAEAGFAGVHGKSTVAVRCRDVLSRQDIETFAQNYRRRTVQGLNEYVSYLIETKQPPAVNDVLISSVIAGYESGRPVLRYFDLSFTGFNDTQVHFRVSKKVACPGDAECKDLKLAAGEKNAIVARTGKYKNVRDKLLLAEELVGIEIEAHRKSQYVLPPISVVQIKDQKPHWFRRGLCT